ncbi:MAG: hypothetical protein AAGB34_03200 [Planctomycetota bacterium]
MIRTQADWANTLRRVAEPVIARHPLPQEAQAFMVNGSPIRDGNDPFFGWRRSRHGEQTGKVIASDDAGGDTRLWACLIEKVSPLSALNQGERQRTDSGSLFPQSSARTIEVWTEQELSSAHALWWIVRTAADTALARILDRAIDWHIENIQPDNATNRPWSIHVFAERGLQGHAEAMLYAETLLHNTLSGTGEPEPFSAHILMDAAEGLDMD